MAKYRVQTAEKKTAWTVVIAESQLEASSVSSRYTNVMMMMMMMINIAVVVVVAH